MKKTNTGDIRKPVWIYALVTVVAGVVSIWMRRHGCEDSEAIKIIAVYPLVAGFFGYLVIGRAASHAGASEYYRMFSWIYNSGIAILTLQQFLAGIFGESGGIPAYLRMASIAGWTLLAVGLVVLMIAEKESVKGV